MNRSDAAAPGDAASDRVLSSVVRAESARIVGALTTRLGSFELAEEAVAEAVEEALIHWRRSGVPPNPGGWLTTAARRNALDRLRRKKRYREKLAQIGESLTEHDGEGPAETDERLPTLFACCHPALPAAAQLALTLRAVCGLTTAQIARATLSTPTAVGQRIVRAKRKITASGIPLRVPQGDERSSRLDIVLTVVSVMYSEAHLIDGGDAAADRDVADDALWLAQVIATALSDEPEAHGLVALLSFHRSRERARAVDGELVLLADQDRSRWDEALIAAGQRALERAAALRRPGRWQLHAAIAACHSDARPRPGAAEVDTDWTQIVVLYDMLLVFDASPVVRLNRAVALGEWGRPAAALTEVDALADRLEDFHLWHAVRAHLLLRLGRRTEAKAADARAQALTTNLAEQRLLAARLAAPLS
ncbi:DUF6596 domain-containing protein [Microbacterium sp. H1-D42]|uniref:RNA polymerase sigma factor n=1 Tax=Microbacterium sp. H1-D42 TaxID=2925844 RepID=UPI001F52D431|nr:DUF6596 domain-containing protein [Microbacterium sp. H1-D42]UNK69594.1 RNA polymerase sigma factor [Microbacterium sp. H1-D42]